ncbi:MAG: SH3 domain-containing protein, partial [Phototrophicaceae bacterium]
SFGTLTLRANGSFEYLTDPNAGATVDGFRYSVLDSANNRLAALVCIAVSDLAISVPGDQFTEVTSAIPIPGIIINVPSTDANIPIVVELSVGSGTLSLTGVSDGAVPTPAEECQRIQLGRRIVSAPTPPEGRRIVVDSGRTPLQTVPSTISRSAVPVLMSSVALQPPGPVRAQGNNSNNVRLEGLPADVNVVLATLIYTPSAVGVEELIVVANQNVPAAGGGVNRTGLATNSVTIYIGQRGGGGGTTSVAPFAPTGPLTLNEFNNTPNSVVRGNVPGGAVVNGDVFVRLVAVNGVLRVRSEQLGDPFLINSDLIHGAEIFGLTFTGLPIQPFSAQVKICLQGSGTFYYRDATGSPRTTAELQTFNENGFTCSNVPNSGLAVLVSDGSPTDLVPNAPEARVELAACSVTTRAIMNLRTTPDGNGAILRLIPFDVTLTAFARQGLWYEVDYNGQRGWLSSGFLTPEEGCS